MVYVDLPGVPECQKIPPGLAMAQSKNKCEKPQQNEEEENGNRDVNMSSKDMNDNQTSDINEILTLSDECGKNVAKHESSSAKTLEYESGESCSRIRCPRDNEVEKSGDASSEDRLKNINETMNLMNNESNFVLRHTNIDKDAENNSVSNENLTTGYDNATCASENFDSDDYEIEIITEHDSLENESSPVHRVREKSSSNLTTNVALNLSTTLKKAEGAKRDSASENALCNFETSVTQNEPSVLDSPVSVLEYIESRGESNDTLPLPNCFLGGFEIARDLNNLHDFDCNQFDDDDYDTTIIVQEGDDDDSVIVLQTEHSPNRSSIGGACYRPPNILWTEPRVLSSLSDVSLIDVEDASLWRDCSLLRDYSPSLECSPFKDIASLNDFSLMGEFSPSPLQDVSPLEATSLISTRDNSPSRENSPLKELFHRDMSLSSPQYRPSSNNDHLISESHHLSPARITSHIINTDHQNTAHLKKMLKDIPSTSFSSKTATNDAVPETLTINPDAHEDFVTTSAITNTDQQNFVPAISPIMDKSRQDFVPAVSPAVDKTIQEFVPEISTVTDKHQRDFVPVVSTATDKVQQDCVPIIPTSADEDQQSLVPVISPVRDKTQHDFVPEVSPTSDKIQQDIVPAISPVLVPDVSPSTDKVQQEFVQSVSNATCKVQQDIVSTISPVMDKSQQDFVPVVSSALDKDQLDIIPATSPVTNKSQQDFVPAVSPVKDKIHQDFLPGSPAIIDKAQEDTSPVTSPTTDKAQRLTVPTINVLTPNDIDLAKEEFTSLEKSLQLQQNELPFSAEKHKSRGILASCQVPKSVAEVPEALLNLKEAHKESPLKHTNSRGSNSLKGKFSKSNSWRDFKLNPSDIVSTLVEPYPRTCQREGRKSDNTNTKVPQTSIKVPTTTKEDADISESGKGGSTTKEDECESFGPRFFADLCSLWPDIIVRLAHDITLESPSVEDAPDPPDPPSADHERRQSCDGEEASLGSLGSLGSLQNLQSPRPAPNSPRPQPEGKCCSDEDPCCPQLMAEHTSELRATAAAAAASAAATGSPKRQELLTGPCISAGLQPATCPSPICGSPAPRRPRPMSSSGPSSVDSVDSTDTGDISMTEYFSGDLEDLLEATTPPDGDLEDAAGRSSGSWDQKPNERKRRKLPEIPKNKKSFSTASILALRSGPTLAEELHEAESGVASRSSTPDALTLINNHSRPILVLKCHSYIRDDSSSPDSELRLPINDIDSGNSTQHSPDGAKSMSPQATVNESLSPLSPGSGGVPFPQLELLEATHRGLYRFIPRHHDEVEIEIGDPIYVQKEAEDLWCEGVNLRTGRQGIFPGAHVTDVDYSDFDPSVPKVKKERYLLNYLGSIETLCHKGNQVLCQAVRKIAGGEESVQHPHPCILEVSDQGIRMVDKSKPGPNHVTCHDYFYHLKHVSFCAFHPKDHRYFGFITKHPTIQRFACHVFRSNDSTRPVAEAVGRAFQRFYQKFIETAYPIEDIYLE